MFFKNRTKVFFDKAEKYIGGLFLSPRRNIEKICESIANTDYYQMQHFISDSNWDARAVMDQVVKDTSATLPRRKLTGLIIDETGTVKKGDKSVGVSWQYCGNAGKTANSQVSVLACLSNGDFASLVDARLYLPQSWTEDKQRCQQAGIPEQAQVFKTKTELAFDIIRHQKSLGIDFDFVGADGFYGNDMDFARKIDGLGCLYMLDIHKDQQIFTEEPELILPAKRGTRGRTPRQLKPSTKSQSVLAYKESLQAKDWVKIKVRNTAKGKLIAKYHFAKVYIINKNRNEVEHRLLVMRKINTKKGTEIKYSFTNANLEQYTQDGLAYMQAQRFFIEHSIKESKQVLGMSQFQTRKWNAWQHQVALNILTASFMLKEKLLNFEDVPLLSAWDIRELIAFLLIRELDDKDILQVILSRHKLRQIDMNRYYNKKKPNLSK